MQLTRLWREHLEAGCPSELQGVEIAGSNAIALDAEITACVSVLIIQPRTADVRIERRLEEIRAALEAAADRSEGVAEYCGRLNRLISAALICLHERRPQ
jgi:hypothetical protein